MKKYNYILSAVTAGIAGYIFYETSTYKIGKNFQKNPAVWPRILAILLLILAVALVISTIIDKSEEMKNASIPWTSEGMKKVYITFGFILVYVTVQKFFGMLIALLILIPALMWLMGCKSRKMYIILPAGIVLFVYLFFAVAMKINLPAPFWA